MAAFEFGPFLLDPAKRSLLRDGIPQSMTPKAFDVLALLVQHRERVLSKEELLSTLWADDLRRGSEPEPADFRAPTDAER